MTRVVKLGYSQNDLHYEPEGVHFKTEGVTSVDPRL